MLQLLNPSIPISSNANELGRAKFFFLAAAAPAYLYKFTLNLLHKLRTRSLATLAFVMSSTTIEQPGVDNLLAISSFSFVHLPDKTVVIKLPLSDTEEDSQPIICEATIYKMLGKHPRIAECLSMDSTDYVDIKYYPNGDLESYLRKNESSIAPALREN